MKKTLKKSKPGWFKTLVPLLITSETLLLIATLFTRREYGINEIDKIEEYTSYSIALLLCLVTAKIFAENEDEKTLVKMCDATVKSIVIVIVSKLAGPFLVILLLMILGFGG